MSKEPLIDRGGKGFPRGQARCAVLAYPFSEGCRPPRRPPPGGARDPANRRFPGGRAVLFLLCFLALLSPLPAQEEDEEGEEPGAGELPIDSDWIDVTFDTYAPGDQTFIVSLGMIFPAVFWGDRGTRWFFDSNLNLGGTASLSYNYFFTSNFYLGGELGGMFAGTLEKNMYYAVPFGVRAGYQFLWRRFEFPLNILVGAIPQKYRDKGYFGFILKPGASVFWRFNTDWSFGLNLAWWWVPQWTDIPRENVQGSFLEITLSVRYHL